MAPAAGTGRLTKERKPGATTPLASDFASDTEPAGSRFYSCRSATTGSTRMARRAGI